MIKKKRPVLQDVADRVGVTKMTVSRYLRNPEQVSAALRGKIAAVLDELGYIPNRTPHILANSTSRAIGETMIVAIAAGQRPILTLDPRETIATMTSYIVQAATGDQPTGSTAYYALFAVGFTLFLLTLFLNILAQYVVERYRERYE